jgi:biotin transport system substrate-specific component
MAMNYSNLLHETVEERSWLKEVALVLGASLIIALFKPLAIPLTPVPVAVQGHVILLLACLLGSKRASMAVLLFLIQGAYGLPVFASGKMGLLAFAGATGGFLIGYLPAAFCTGYLMERFKQPTPLKAVLAMTVGNIIVYLFGIPWLAQFTGFSTAFVVGMLPFLLPDMLKLFAATRILKSFRCFQ